MQIQKEQKTHPLSKGMKLHCSSRNADSTSSKLHRVLLD